MKIKSGVFLFCILIAQSLYAQNYHKRIPFEMQLKLGDTVSVHYDFREKIGIHCDSDSAHLKIKFKYKGHAKSCLLPVTLEIDHLPSKAREHLADNLGQFKITNNKISIPGLNAKASPTIKCKFLSGK